VSDTKTTHDQIQPPPPPEEYQGTHLRNTSLPDAITDPAQNPALPAATTTRPETLRSTTW
jgi:hypothetical protein